MEAEKIIPQQQQQDLGVMKQIGNYIILLQNNLGKGTFSEVFLASIVQGLRQKLICKVFEKRYIDDRGQLRQQIKRWQRIKHPNIVQIYDYFQNDSKVYIFMEYCDGLNLSENITQPNLNEEFKILNIFSQILEGSMRLEEEGIIHQQLNLNSIIFHEGIPKIEFSFYINTINFAKVNVNLSIQKEIFLSPQVLLDEQFTSKCNVWSIGCMLYEMITRKKCSKEDYFIKDLEQLREFNPSIQISQEFRNFIIQMLKKDEKDRPTLQESLQKFQQMFTLQKQEFYKNYQTKIWLQQ